MSKQITTWSGLQQQLETNLSTYQRLLPANVRPEKFIASALAAVKQNPALMKTDHRSLFNALERSAQDGLLPDGRQGVITPYKNEAQWNPMIGGLRKRARELDGIIIDAQVVYANDTFVWHQGDDPKIEHIPAALGQPRGPMIGVYAIFKNAEEGILHREVMDAEQIEAVRSQSKKPDGLLWVKFATEAWRKAVVRRGIKSVPCSEDFDAIARRDDQEYDFEGSAQEANGGKRSAKREPPNVVEATTEQQPTRELPPKAGEARKQPQEPVEDAQIVEEEPAQEQEEIQALEAGQTPEQLLVTAEEQLVKAAAVSVESFDRWANVFLEHPELQFPGDNMKLKEIIEKHRPKG